VSKPKIDAQRFRGVLGNFPTGVAVITALDDRGEPAGMAIGSFVSVSLDPPLVGFYPTRDSRSFARMRSSASFCVNIIGAHQEHLCRAFAGRHEDKFAGVDWDSAPSGAPRLSGVAAWIDCDFEAVTEAGDHFHVLGRVRDLDASPTTLPLVFFQGGYGRFAPASMVAIPDPEVIGYLQHADLARSEIELLAGELDAEILATAAVDDQLVVIAGAGVPASEVGRTRVGQRSPMVPPLGTLFVAGAGPEAERAWLDRADPSLSAEQVRHYREMLDRVRARGWSVTLASPTQVALELAYHSYSRGRSTHDNSERIRALAASVPDHYEPADPELAGPVDVRMISVPITDETGRVRMLLSAWGLAEPLTGSEIQQVAERLKASATRIEALGARSGG